MRKSELPNLKEILREYERSISWLESRTRALEISKTLYLQIPFHYLSYRQRGKLCQHEIARTVMMQEYSDTTRTLRVRPQLVQLHVDAERHNCEERLVVRVDRSTLRPRLNNFNFQNWADGVKCCRRVHCGAKQARVTVT